MADAESGTPYSRYGLRVALNWGFITMGYSTFCAVDMVSFVPYLGSEHRNRLLQHLRFICVQKPGVDATGGCGSRARGQKSNAGNFNASEVCWVCQTTQKRDFRYVGESIQ